MPKRSGFTLIELLIVVAIIGILAAIAIPNFLEAHTRAGVARIHADMRTQALCLEMYCVDYGVYPPSALPGATQLIMPPLARLVALTTPVAYMSAVPIDVFKTRAGQKLPDCQIAKQAFRYREDAGFTIVRGFWPLAPYRWELNTFGPDKDCDGGILVVQYDPTNGTISNGDISRAGP